ncbi:MAG: manganese efflux pump MntP family protein [Sandaracinaceae bacterium]|nr:manganese efflux pump MntP family protein [Sandaracinaceae bacterium]
MSFASILVLAIGLSMDAAAVSAARGLAVPAVRPRHALLVALYFGGFQALMPLLGWLVGASFGAYVEAWDHWIAFVLLGALGAKMLWEARKSDDDDDEAARGRAEAELFAHSVMLALAIATSIDALAAGVTLPMLRAPLALSIATIGIVTALLSVLGLLVGRRFGALLGKRLDVVGGLALIGLGTKILIEHLAA